MAFDITHQALLPGFTEHLPDHPRQPLPPWRGVDPEARFDLPAIKNRVHRTPGRGRVLIGSDRLNPGTCRQLRGRLNEDRLGEAVPADGAGPREMVSAPLGLASFDVFGDRH